jgi:hypothetical protein
MAWPTLSTAESSHGKRRRFHDTQRESMRGSEQKIMAGGQRLCGRLALGNTCSQPSSSTVTLGGIERPRDNALQ